MNSETANPDAVYVRAITRHGLTLVRLYAREDGCWQDWTPPSHRQLRNGMSATELAELPHRGIGKPSARTLRQGERVDLGEGVTPEGSTLVVILDALRSAGRNAVDRDDVKLVLSQLGSRVAQLGTLTEEQRRHAEPALHAEILRRCTTV